MSESAAAPSTHRSFAPVGDVWYDHCPICEDSRIGCVWRIPFSKLGVVSDTEKLTLNGYAIQYFPMYGDVGRIYQYYACNACESIFLNPQTSQTKTHYANPSNLGAQRKIDRSRQGRDEASWKGYIRNYERRIKPHLPAGTKVVLDAGCGGGQYLILTKEDSEVQAKRLIGLELSPIAVDNLRVLGLEAYQCDLDNSDSLLFLESGSVDFVIFAEIFEHTFFPFRSMSQLVRTLRPGGRLYFTAQRQDPKLPIRPSENQCITELGLSTIVEKLGCHVVHR